MRISYAILQTNYVAASTLTRLINPLYFGKTSVSGMSTLQESVLLRHGIIIGKVESNDQ